MFTDEVPLHLVQTREYMRVRRGAKRDIYQRHPQGGGSSMMVFGDVTPQGALLLNKIVGPLNSAGESGTTRSEWWFYLTIRQLLFTYLPYNEQLASGNEIEWHVCSPDLNLSLIHI